MPVRHLADANVGHGSAQTLFHHPLARPESDDEEAATEAAAREAAAAPGPWWATPGDQM